MELTRLKELTAAKTVVETKVEQKNRADIDGIREIVEDALGDLKDKLGKGGSLSELMRTSGASKLDKIKGEDGKTVLQAITTLTAAYVSQIEKLMTEADLMVSQMSEGLIEEAKEYSDSSEFTDEFFGMSQQIAKMKQQMKNPRWLEWMKTTDTNFATDCETPARDAIESINNLDRDFKAIEDEFDKADNA